MQIGFYVTMQRGGRTAWLLGPYFTHKEALDIVDETRTEVEQLDPRAIFDAFGTSSITRESDEPLPIGTLDKIRNSRKAA